MVEIKNPTDNEIFLTEFISLVLTLYFNPLGKFHDNLILNAIPGFSSSASFEAQLGLDFLVPGKSVLQETTSGQLNVLIYDFVAKAVTKILLYPKRVQRDECLATQFAKQFEAQNKRLNDPRVALAMAFLRHGVIMPAFRGLCANVMSTSMWA